MTQHAETPGVIAFPPLMLLVSVMTGFILSAVAPLGWLVQIGPQIRYLIGGALAGTALVAALLAVTKFGAAKTPVNPNFTPTALVTGGVFRLLRNPMYLSFYLLSLGLTVAFAAEWLIATTVILAALIHYGVIKREERFLERKFGDAYAAYCARVRRYGLF